MMLLSELGWGNNGGPPWRDLSAEKINPDYFREVDKRIAWANEQGLTVGVALAWGEKSRREPYAWSQFPDQAARERFARYVSGRYSAFNV
ncbi:MAG: DUF4038 domain-containing protein [Opitutaceae bacterium]|nr:DUF4038 domain-containing protein [Opitutaceae bacterium]